MIEIKYTGNFSKLNSYLENLKGIIKQSTLDKYAKLGLEALRNATPRKTGKTAESWYYIITRKRDQYRISWCNSNINENCNIALLIQYGHALNNGVYLDGIDYINPAMKPVFEQLANELWKEVTKN